VEHAPDERRVEWGLISWSTFESSTEIPWGLILRVPRPEQGNEEYSISNYDGILPLVHSGPAN
jgi:hypothetical protein